MVKLTPIVRLLLVSLAAGISVTVSVVDIPDYLQGLIIGINVFFAGLGVIPPQVPAITTVRNDGNDIVARQG